MAATIIGPVSASPGLPGGILSALNATAAFVIKAESGVLVRIWPTTVGTGVLTLNDANNNISAQTITGITAATNAVVTISTGGSTNPFAVGNSVGFASVVGMTQINGLLGTVTAIGGVTTAWTITVSINSSTFTAYASAGTIGAFIAANQIVSIPVASMTAGVPVLAEWPCYYGLAASAFPTSGLYSFSFS